MHPIDSQSGRELWVSYIEVNPRFATEQPTFERFGDSAAMADDLLKRVLAGHKTATSSLVGEYEAESEPLPRIGQHWMVADAVGSVRAIVRTKQLRVGALSSGDEQFAYDEGDRTRDYWLMAHRNFFSRSCGRLGIGAHSLSDVDAMEVVFERFSVVWPETP